jgi:hypothetical protein
LATLLDSSASKISDEELRELEELIRRARQEKSK